METLTLEFDGGSRGNPGPAGIGVVVRAADGTPLVTLGRYIGKATNNVAEYRALIAGLEAASATPSRAVKVRGDSKLVIEQVAGRWKVKQEHLRPLHAEVTEALRHLGSWSIRHVRRGENERADELLNEALDAAS